ncbi:hypothetical protein [Henriciella sp.]|uniref:hypothetical protein n=1 Tax=Henriciella sp. TaxID=1968823 RepID=UPI002625CB86|nr:hypothetical protein [Henriciella sp.]
MNDTVFAGLPRFDTATQRRSRIGEDYASVSTASAASKSEAAAQDSGDSTQDALEAVQAEAVQRLSAIEETLTRLSVAAEEIDTRLRQQATQNVTAIAEKLFPQMSRLFLAEEICRHLPDLLPLAAPSVTIRVEAQLADDLRSVVERSEELAGFCTVTEDAAPGANRVTIDWKEGGADVDFDRLLETCLERLKAANSNA